MEVDQFYALCISIATYRGTNGSPTSLSPTVTLVSPTTSTFGHLDLKDVEGVYPFAISDFHGLPTNPRSVYKTGDVWPLREGPEAQLVVRQARPVCSHPIGEVWHELGERIYRYLDSIDLKWTSIDPVRFAEEDGEPGPLYLWIGVMPGSLSFKDAKSAAESCKYILVNAGFLQVEIAFRESIYTRSSGAQLLNYVSTLDPTADLRSPFTPALGLQIAPQKTPYLEGTAALFFRESSDSERVFLLTARHVALPMPEYKNKLYECKRTGTPARDVLLLGSRAYADALEAIMANIGVELINIRSYEDEIKTLGEEDQGTRGQYQALIAKAQETVDALNAFHGDITKNWSVPSQRVLGYVLHSPAISVGTGPKRYTEDWALIDLYREKINWDVFKGNAIHLGNKISRADFVKKMHPHHEGQTDFKYPPGGLLQIKGFVEEEEIRKPKQHDAKGEECLLVIKNGKSTGVTIGRATGIESFVRVYKGYDIESTSMELAVYSYNNKSGAFSAPGDSGSIVVDGKGRIIGMLTGGTGTTDSTDVTYLTPYWWLEQQIKKVFPNCFLFPMVN